MLPFVEPCALCSIAAARVLLENDHAIAVAADPAVVEGRTLIVPKEHVASVHALPIPAQKGVWALLAAVRERLKPEHLMLGFLDGLTAQEQVPHAVIHLVPTKLSDGDRRLP
jgi:diadenosine tetraphosphate (Ap4A) HIT family hydrolase